MASHNPSHFSPDGKDTLLTPPHIEHAFVSRAGLFSGRPFSRSSSFTHDDWGNETSRTYDGLTATLSYDLLNHLVEYSASGTGSNQEFYAYDANGNRILKRSTSAGTTTLTVDIFGLDEYTYSNAGAQTGQLHYYSIAGHLIGAFDGSKIVSYLTDGLGSVLLCFSAGAILGEQVYGPYGSSRYLVGNLSTDKGYTGQFHDALTGLDYYVARYYDPLVGVFLSVDSVQGNQQGMDPYAYVGGNPETLSDPTGHWGWFSAILTVVAVVAVVAIASVVLAPVIVGGAALAFGAAAAAADTAATVTAIGGATITGAVAMSEAGLISSDVQHGRVSSAANIVNSA